MKTQRKIRTRIICGVLSVVIVAFTIAADIICFQPAMKSMIDSYLGSFKADDIDAKNASYESATEIGQDITEEGMVLLKNTNNALPLSDVTQVNLFGYASAHLYRSGGGSGSISSSDSASIKDALESVGIKVNETLYSKYENYTDGTENDVYVTHEIQPAISDQNFYSDSLWQEYEEFSDVAIMSIGRTGCEAMDDPHGYLTISQEERDLLTELENRFDKVIVLLNIGNAMELGFLDDAEVDAAILVNYPGVRGIYALGKLLTGEANFSGKTADTYSYDHSTAPSYNNAGLEATRMYDGMELDEMGLGYYYVDYNEGIYVGYRYYETRFVDNTTGEVDEAAYRSTVQYPFGYGLSYTSFEQSIVSCDGELTQNGSDTITLTVHVVNTGTKSGKDVVEVYETAPYYIDGIEKSQVVLVGFAKTDELQPGESQDVQVSFMVQDLSSYDWNDKNQNGHTGYELEAGLYTISIRSDAHTEIDSVALELDDTVYFDTDSTTGATITNLFDDVSGVDETEEIVYLSRADWEGTWSGGDGREDSALDGSHRFGYDGTYTVGREASEAVKNSTNAYLESHYADDDPDVSMPTLSADNNLTLADMTDVDYDDVLWDQLLDQMSVAEMQRLISNGGYAIGDVPSIGLANCKAVDGPNMINSAFSMNGGESDLSCYGYPNDTMVACTWNTQMAYQKGWSLSNEASTVSVVELYAPAVNIHRSPYSGRNWEYYSEDGVLTGKLAAAMVQGCNENDLMTTVKHFALNDQETSRNMNGIYTWCNEQAMRELYLRSFEIAIKEGDGLGVMTSFNRIGATWTGASKALLTDLLRGEWGFVGTVETDAYFPSFGDDSMYMSPNLGIRAGNDLWLQSGTAFSPDTNVSEAATVVAMREACHNILYSLSRTNAPEIDVDNSLQPWSIALIVLSCIIYLGVVFAIYRVFIRKPTPVCTIMDESTK